MKKNLSILAATLVVGASGASAQGLLSIGHSSNEDFDTKLPFTTTLGVDVGWDSNPNNRPDGQEQDSAYIRGGVDAAYANGSRTTNVSLNAGFSTIYYLDQPVNQEDDTFYSARLGLNVTHRASRQLTVGNNFYLTYEIEPDNVVGASAARRLGQYLYGYNSAWASYAWNRRFSTVSRYTLSMIDYEDEDGFGEDRVTHTFSQEMRYVLNRLTTLVGEARYSLTEYDNGLRDYDSLYLLAGVDHSFSSDLRAIVRVGAENRNYDNGQGSDWRPYAETALHYKVSKHSNLAWVNRIGFEDSELGATEYDTRYSYRSSLTYNQQLNERLRANAGLSYVHSQFEGGNLTDVSEDLVSARFGVGYRLFSNVDLNSSISYSLLNSDEILREYDRLRLSAGVSLTF